MLHRSSRHLAKFGAGTPDAAVLAAHLLKLLERYLNTGTYTGSSTEYADYRRGLLEFLQ